MRTRRSLFFALVVLNACAAPSNHGQDVAVSRAALTWADGRNTIDVQTTIDAPRCDGEQGLMTVNGTFTANAALTIALVATVDEGASTQIIEVVTPDVWIPAGTSYTASFGTDVNVPNGQHRIEVCFGVITSRGLSTVRGCVGTIQTDQDCSEPPPPPPPPPDTTAPSIVGSRAPAPNAQGWNNTDVTVSFDCSDADSGVASCTSPVTLSAEGVGHSVTGTAVDNAGNSASDTVSNINIDKTAPSIAASRSVPPNAAGWNNEAVTVSFDCNDDLSGIASCSDAVTFDMEGTGFSADGSATDNADNSAGTSEGPVNIDLTPPDVSFTGSLSYAWDETVSITCSASDALSGIESTNCADITGPASSFGAGTHSISATATDAAGNVTTVTDSFTVAEEPPPPPPPPGPTTSSVCELTTLYASSGYFSRIGCSLLTKAQKEFDAGRNSFGNFWIKHYISWVKCQRWAFSAEEKADLIAQATLLLR